MRLKTIISIVNSVQTPSELIPPVPNVSADDVNYDLNIDQTHLPKTVAPDPTDNVLKLNCPFCKKFLSNSSNGRPLLFCFDCQTSDSLRAPVQIPVEVSPASSVPMSMEMRSFSSQLELNKWNITRFWKFFAKKNKKKSNDKPKQRKANSSFQARKLFLRGRYGSGLKNIFSGKLTDNNLETVEKLKSLHPTENFCPSKPSVCQYWLENPFQAQEVLNAVAKLPKGKAAGPSGISFDLLKTACKNAPEICEDLASYFQNLMCLNYVPPHELTAARLVALVKPGKGDKPDGVRPIAIGESLTRLLSSLIFNRISTKARDYLKPFQFGTKTVEGASVASMTSDVFFNSQQQQYIFNLDFKNAFNSVKRNCIFDVLFLNNICSSAVLNQDLHSLLLEKGVCENKVSDSSLFVTIVPRRFGLCATNEAFVTKMRLYLNIPINQLLSKEKCICSNSPQLTLRHALNCSKLITCRSSLHDAVRDTVFNMAQTARISCIKEPLLKETLSLNNFGSDDRGDVYCDWIDNSEAIVDFVSCNVANDTLVHRRKLNPVAALDFKAKEKHRKYDKEIEDANIDRNTQLVFIAFPFSINGRLSVEAETFLDDFQKMVKEKTMKRFDIFLWRSRIQFAIINRLPRFFNRIREALARQQANQDFVEEILV
ncbi:hypothetical protein P9112_014435 [Eukaryota sp. TZLM1-RC]